MKLCWLLGCVTLIGAASEVFFKNSCGYPIDVIVTEDYASPTLLVNIPSPGIRMQAFRTGGMNFKVGWSGKTRVEFWFNKNERDFYDINILTGFDVPVAIEPRKGARIQCTYSNCNDGIIFPHEMSSKMHAMPTDGRFNVIFCPAASARRD